IVDYREPSSCPACGQREFTQDPDVLDTWFSSALWPFSTLGWPDQTSDLKHFFPTSVLVTGYDIIYFWVARMIFMSLEFLEEVPFGTVYINGLVRDHLGRKMSKSLGNGIDPLEVIGDYGADTLRFTLITGQAPGHDQRFRQENVEAGRNFSNKIWNASRFVLMNLSPADGEEYESVEYDSKEPDFIEINPLSLPPDLNRADRWILHRYNKAVCGVTERLQEYELGEAARLVYEFLWNDFCDWYLELSKYYLYRKEGGEAAAQDCRRTRGVLVYVLEGVLRLLHPFMPFISEEIWHHLPCRSSCSREPLVVACWPQYCKGLEFPREAAEMAAAQEVIRAIRNLRSQVQLPPTKRAPVVLRTSEKIKTVLEQESHQLFRLALADPLTIDSQVSKPRRALTAVVSREVDVYLPLSGVIDLEAEIARLQKELQQVEKDLKRTRGKLANRGFLQQAPAEIVDKEQARSRELTSRQEKLKERIQELT
ncbi:MAG TPA: class I tRNA ligase family protein, partial [Firmicutes bacterium]|nr:class I tRNA ligase family protein [Bacillota bacterium]